MNVFYHCIWNYCRENEAFLQQRGIAYEWYQEGSFSWLIVDISEEDTFCSDVLKLSGESLPIRYYEYTKKDLMSVEYLTIRAKNLSIDLTNNIVFEPVIVE